MKLNKKRLLNGVLIPLVVSVPTVVAISCGNSINNTSIKQPKVKHKQIPFATAPMLSLNTYFQEFVSKIDSNKSSILEKQKKTTIDDALIAFAGYIESDGTKKGATQKQILDSKKEFSKNIEILKKDFNKLFDMVLQNQKASTSLMSPALNKLVSYAAKDKKGSILSSTLAKGILKKMQMIINNLFNTMINIEDSKQPSFLKNAKLIGNLTETKKLEAAKINTTKLSNSFDKPFSDKVLMKKQAHNFNLIKGNFVGIFARGALGGTELNNVGKQELKDSGWQAGISYLKEQIKDHKENVQLFKDKTTSNVYFKVNTTTTTLANNFKSHVKFNEEYVDSLLDDDLLKNIQPFLWKIINKEEIAKDDIKLVFKDKEKLVKFLNKIQLILEEFGKNLQFMEVNLQMLVSHLLGSDAQFYGGANFKNDDYTLIPEDFTSPQFNVYKYKNYKSYIDSVKQDTLKHGLKITISKGILKLMTLDVLDIIKNITRDPLSNYTMGIFQIVQLLTEGMDDKVIKV